MFGSMLTKELLLLPWFVACEDDDGNDDDCCCCCLCGKDQSDGIAFHPNHPRPEALTVPYKLQPGIGVYCAEAIMVGADV